MDKLFTRGSTEAKTFYLFPFRVLYLTDEAFTSPLPQVLFSVSKRNFKHAAGRNLIRRRCKEAYRRNKPDFTHLSPQKRPAYLAFLYLAKEKLEYHVIEAALQQLFRRLENRKS